MVLPRNKDANTSAKKIVSPGPRVADSQTMLVPPEVWRNEPGKATAINPVMNVPDSYWCRYGMAKDGRMIWVGANSGFVLSKRYKMSNTTDVLRREQLNKAAHISIQVRAADTLIEVAWNGFLWEHLHDAEGMK